MVCSLISIVCVFFWSPVVKATIPKERIEIYNASRVEKPSTVQSTTGTDSTTTTTGAFKVYGGIAGAANVGECTDASATVCNNCDGSNKPCNANRISSNSYLKFEFQVTDVSQLGEKTIMMKGEGDTTITIPDSQKSGSPYAANTTLFVQVRWGQLCKIIGASSVAADSEIAGVCDKPKSDPYTLQVGFGSGSTMSEYFEVQIFVAGSPADSSYRYSTKCPPGENNAASNTGFCWFEVERGDEKVYITNEAQRQILSDESSSVDYTALRVYYGVGDPVCNESQTADNSFKRFVNSNSAYKDLTFTKSGEETVILDNPIISGLTNGLTYYFRFANVDAAGNVFYFAASAQDEDVGDKKQLTCALHSKVPQEVVGVLDGKACFIATAAYGTPMAPQVEILRRFRDTYLLSSQIGAWLVRQYYEYSPRWARKIQKSESARAVVRGILRPVIFAAQWIIQYGLKAFLILVSLGLSLGFWGLRAWVRKHE